MRPLVPINPDPSSPIGPVPVAVVRPGTGPGPVLLPDRVARLLVGSRGSVWGRNCMAWDGFIAGVNDWIGRGQHLASNCLQELDSSVKGLK